MLIIGWKFAWCQRSVKQGGHRSLFKNWKLRSGNFMVAIFLCYSTSTTTRYDDSCWLTQVLACRCGCCFKQRGKRRDDGARGRPLPTGPKGASAAAKACDCGYACCGCGVGLDAAPPRMPILSGTVPKGTHFVPGGQWTEAINRETKGEVRF